VMIGNEDDLAEDRRGDGSSYNSSRRTKLVKSLSVKQTS